MCAPLPASVLTQAISLRADDPPKVALTAPAAGTLYTAPASVALAAQVSDSDGQVVRVKRGVKSCTNA